MQNELANYAHDMTTGKQAITIGGATVGYV